MIKFKFSYCISFSRWIKIFDKNVQDILDAVNSHQAYWRDVLPMIASENITSPLARSMLITDLSHRYAEGKVGHRFYQGCKYIDEIELKTIELSKELFKAEHVNVQPISGVNANIAAFFALSKPGDTILSLKVSDGGHISHVKYSAAGLRGLKVYSHPFDNERMNIDPERMVDTILEIKPRIVLFGASLFLFPHPVKEAVDAAKEVGADIVYDAAHVLGLIAGGKFQDPLREGADIMTASTHKTFPGPQGGIIFCKKEYAKEIDLAVFPGTVSNHHLHHLAALGITTAEMIKFGKEYAEQVVKNAKYLAKDLYNRGFNVLCKKYGFTESHQIVIDISSISNGKDAATKLEDAGIVVNANLLPKDVDSNIDDVSGIRIGVQELTRLGMREKEMKKVAEFIERVLLSEEKLSIIKEEVTAMKRTYQNVFYCFDFGRDNAYSFDFFNLI